MDCCAHEGPGKGDAKFDVTKVADGVYAAVAAPAYKVNCNTAIIESDDGVMTVDTHSKPSAARVIVEHLRQITSKPVRYVVNTHFHWDHSFPGSIDEIKERGDITDAQKRKILGDNTRRLYGLKP